LEGGMKIPPFTWSPSKLNCFEICPEKYAAEYVYKTVPYQETAATVWGNRLHKAAEIFMKKKEIKDEEAFKIVEPYVRLFSKISGYHYIEHRIALNKDWQQCSWYEAVGRMVLDFGVSPAAKKFLGVDYKSGKMKSDFTQMQIYALALSKLLPFIDEFDMRYVWLKEGKITGFKVNREDLKPIEIDIKERLARMQDAHENVVFNARRNGLCKNYCGNASCPHNGR
jgi:hypothetical protein